MTNLEAAAEAIRGKGPWLAARDALDVIDPRLAALTPEDTKAVLDSFVAEFPGSRIAEVLSR